MVNRLLDRQANLLEYLTSGAAIFDKKSGGPVPRSLNGIDVRLLRLEARFSYEKRMERIAAAFPRTFGLLDDAARVMRQFAEKCPPIDINRLTNARQFHAFLAARWRRKPPSPAYLRDVARCELACAEVRAHLQEGDPGTANGNVPRGGIRRHPDAVLLRCRFDVRPIFEEGLNAVPTARVTRLAVTMPSGANHPQVFELPPAVFNLIAALDDWMDPTALAVTRNFEQLVRELAEHGVVEVHG
jgi:hypothetical protein